MATRLTYALPLARQLLRSTARRVSPGGLAAALPQPDADNPFIIVTGTGRSGTSAVARVLHESGLTLGRTFDPPSDQNRVGFYEDTKVREINFAIVSDLGLSDLRRAARWPWRSATLAVAESYTRQMRALATSGANPPEVRGWKDPVFCVTLEAWLPYLPQRPQVVVCLRSSEAFLHSVTQIYGLVERGHVERLWEQELRRLLDVIDDYRLEAICIEYDDLVLSPATVIARLASFVGRPLDASYVDAELRHHAYAVPERHAAIYQHVRRLGGAAHSIEAQSPSRAERPSRAEVDEYLRRVRELDARVDAAFEEWLAATGAPELSNHNVTATETASANYVQVVSKVQTLLGELASPEGFAAYHEAVRGDVNNYRLVAQVTLQAAQNQRPSIDVRRAFEACLSPNARAAAKTARRAVYERALRATGYSEVGSGE